MNNTATNGGHDASSSSSSSSSSRRGDIHDNSDDKTKTKTNGSASSPLSAAAQLLHTTGTETTTAANGGINDTDLALSLDLPEHNQTPSSQPSPRKLEEDNNNYGPNEASYYWDASTMAPLNAVSAVSIVYIYLKNHNTSLRSLVFSASCISPAHAPFFFYIDVA